MTDHELRELGIDPEEWAALGLASPLARPRPDLRNRLLKSVRRLHELEPGIRVARASSDAWSKTKYPGVYLRVLHTEPQSKMVTCLLRIDPGFAYPRHRHVKPEHAYVVEGSCSIGSITLHAGDFQVADADTEHDLLTAGSNGCVLLIYSCLEDEVHT